MNELETLAFLSQTSPIHLVSISDTSVVGRHFGDDVAAATAWAESQNAAERGIYWTVNAVRPGVHTKASKPDITRPLFLHVDIDPASDGTAFDKPAKLRQLQTAPTPPSFIIDSGGGLQAFWRIVTPGLGDPGLDTATVEAANRALIAQFDGDRPCWNIDRVMRLPGTVNWPNAKKRAKGRTTVTAAMLQHDTGGTICAAKVQALADAAPPPSAPHDPVTLPDDVTLQTCESLGIQLGELRAAIELPRGDDRSGDLARAAALCLSRGIALPDVFGLLLNTDNPVVAAANEKPNLERQVTRAIDWATASHNAPTVPPPPASGPIPLEAGLLPVPPFDLEFLPDQLRDWCADIAARLNVPLDLVAIPALVQLGAVIGRKVGIKPECNTDWQEAANLWGCIVAPPGSLKSPVMAEVLKPIKALEVKASAHNDDERIKYDAGLRLLKLQQAAAEKEAKAFVDAGDSEGALAALVSSPETPRFPVKRHLVNDATMEKLGEICADNPNGVLVHRDEVMSLFGDLSRTENVSSRGFYLTGWGGDDSYTFDRIGRGTIRIPSLNLSLIGTTQPDKMKEFIAEGVGKYNDGMVQRLQLLCWPDAVTGHYVPSRDSINRAARDVAYRCYEALDALTPESIIANHDQYTSFPYLRFSDEAQAAWYEYRVELETMLRQDDLSNSLKEHFGKYRGLIPRLALIMHLASAGTGPVTLGALRRALAFKDYLAAHAWRSYSSADNSEFDGAAALLKRIQDGKLGNAFTVRDVQRKNWVGFKSVENIRDYLYLLQDYGYLTSVTEAINNQNVVKFIAINGKVKL